MKFVIVGINGKMGQEVKKAIFNSGDLLTGGIDTTKDESNNVFTSIYDIQESFDSIIDFSTASQRTELIEFCIDNKIPYGCFSTIINPDDILLFKQLSKTTPVLLCDNASEGVMLMKKLTSLISQNLEGADVVLNEYHHKSKKDAPSGTAKSLINILSEKNIPCETTSHRVGNEVGTHTLEIFLNGEKLTISHTAYNRNVFAYGALRLMHKLSQKPYGLFINEIN